MHKNMRPTFPAPVLAVDDADEAEMRELFGITETSDNGNDTTPPVENSSSTGTTDNNQQSQQVPTPSEDNTDPKTPEQKPVDETNSNTKAPVEDTLLNPEEKFSKQNGAFAQMRIQNKELSTLLMDLAKATGQNPKTLAEAQALLKESLTKVESKKRNIPEDVLREMEEDKRALAEVKQEQAKQRALAGFQNVKDTFALSREDVNKFADKLIEHKLNPFEQDIDLVKEYKNLYFDELIAKAKEQGIQEERARNFKAHNNSTTPGTQQGLPDETGSQGQPIKTVADLDKLLDSLK